MIQYVRSREQNSPNIRSRLNVPELSIPGRIYYHNSGIQAFRGHLNSDDEIEKNGLSLLNKIFGRGVDYRCYSNLDPKVFENSKYFIALLWGRTLGPEPTLYEMVDLFTFTDIENSQDPKNWPSNPEVSAYIFQGGIYLPDEKQVTCGDGTIILGIEEIHRRTRKNLRDFLVNPPEIPGTTFSE